MTEPQVPEVPPTTSIEARQARSLGYGSFTHLTAAAVLTITPDGLLFDGELTDDEVGDIWWFATSADDTDQARREAIAVLVADAEAGTNGSGWLTDAFAVLARYQIGLQ